MNRQLEAFGLPQHTVIEECSEVIKAICKAERFGYRNYHPMTPTVCNARLILDEIKDLKERLNEFEPILLCYARKFEDDLCRPNNG